MELVWNWIVANPLWVVLIILVLFVIFTYNNLNAKKHRVEKSFSVIDVYLTERFDKLESVFRQIEKAYDHESETYTAIAKYRSGITESLEKGDINGKIKATEQVQAFVTSPAFRTEAYPELASIATLGLFGAKETAASEKEIAAARKQYNSNANSYNTKIKSFPTLLIAPLLGFGKPFELFKATEEERKRPMMGE